MGKPERKGRERTCSSSSYLLRCFGISRKTHIEKQVVETGQEKRSKKQKTTSRWFSRGTKFRSEKGEITTKPTYETEKQNLTIEDDKQNLFRVISQVTDRKNIAAVGHDTKEENTSEQRDVNPDPLSFSGHNTCHEDASTTVCGGKVEPSKTVGSGSKRKEPREKSSRVRKLSRVDPVIGISIILLTLMIMLMWGRLCAIVCTSAWCYFLPLLKEAAIAAKRKRSGGGKAEGGAFPDDLELNSEAYKKKVVMEGFLLRQRPRFAVTTF